MLTRLKITNFVLIDELELDLHPGLTVLTGETGSGKSIIIDALMLIFGARTSNDVIRNPTKPTELVAEITFSNTAAITWLTDNDLADMDSHSAVICRRIFDNNGKNKFYINGNVATAAQMRTLGEFILDVHTQHAAITLLKADTQRKLLDEYAGISDQVATLNTYYNHMQDIRQQLTTVQLQQEELLLRKSALEESITELNELCLAEGDWEILEAKHKELTHSSVILDELNHINSILHQQDNSLLRTAHDLSARLSKIAIYTDKLEELAKNFNNLEIDLTEFSRDIGAASNNVTLDPKELAKHEARMEQIFALSRKYKITPKQIPSILTEMKQELATIAHADNINFLHTELEKITAHYNTLAQQVTSKRSQSALELSAKATTLLHTLAITGEFKIILQPLAEPTAFGLEKIEYQVAFNKGMALQPLAKVASGGELSRTALTLYLLLSMQNAPEIIIFDEIDVGIGGKIAAIVGQMLQQLGTKKQVICITHQPQAASHGINHLVVNKEHLDNSTTLNIKYITNIDRITEIARMLGGMTITTTTTQHAKEMLQQAYKQATG